MLIFITEKTPQNHYVQLEIGVCLSCLCHCPHADHCFTHFSAMSQLTPPYIDMTICACDLLLLFQHNAQMLLACNCSHTMLSIMDLSLDLIRCLHHYICAVQPMVIIYRYPSVSKEVGEYVLSSPRVSSGGTPSSRE